MDENLVKNSRNRRSIRLFILAFLFSLFQLSAYAYRKDNSLICLYSNEKAIVLSVAILIGMSFALFAICFFLFELLDKLAKKRTSVAENKEICTGIIALLFCIARFPYLLSFYPGVSAGDACRQVLMFYGFPTKVTGRVVTDGINIRFSAHHPLFTTFLYGGFTKIGELLGNTSYGVFLFSVLQVIISSFIFAFFVKLIGRKCSRRVSVIVFLYVFFSPLISMCTISMCSDVAFGLMCLLATYLIIFPSYTDCAVYRRKWYIVVLTICFLLVALCKKQGYYFVILECILLLWLDRKNWKQWLCILCSEIILFSFLWCKLVYSIFNVAEGGYWEALSLPFQQTARYLIHYEGEISDEEIQAIENVLPVKKIMKKYNPDVADNVKNTYKNKTATKEDLMNYFHYWAVGFFKAPQIYVSAGLNGCYKYFDVTYVGGKEDVFYSWYKATDFYNIYKGPKFYEEYGVSAGDFAILDIEQPHVTLEFRQKLQCFIELLEKVPILNSFFSIATNIWLSLLCIVYTDRNRKYSVAANLIVFLCILTCCLSPMNGMMRYAFPIMFICPFAVGLLFSRNE